MRAKSRGFTLIELILVIVLVGILAVVATVFILPPFQAAADLERRAMLVDATDLAIDRITREARNALPNSLRVPAANQVELITTVTHGRYRRLPAPGGGSEIFVPARSSGTFDVLGGLLEAAAVQVRGPGTDCGTPAGHCLSVYNTGQPGFDAWSGDNLAAITDAGAGFIEYDSGGSGPPFATHSPQQRFHVIDLTVRYVCSGGQLRRQAGYGVGASPSGAGRLVADNITSCQFSYNPGTSARRGLLTVRLDLADEGESVFLLGQAQVLNTP
ncbi:MAG: prepilin-type N-terminal cleavage/methylation domain-containing protein [Gammaproteobacteria bacterium]|jgi:MSHA biogenesis protein MshO|nr:prepilin-type N-terminal cleavage/methylation domain-containing protein [Gammaproteobacteria bacterium]